jgi:hypothetical protein
VKYTMHAHRGFLTAVTAGLILGCTGTAGDAKSPAPSDAVEADRSLTGSDSSSCPLEIDAFLRKSARYGRIASNSPAFRACVKNLATGTPGITARYMPECAPADPFSKQSAQTQVDQLVKLTVRGNPLIMKCDFSRTACNGSQATGPGGNACADIHSPSVLDDQITWADWLNAVYAIVPDKANPAWPMSQAAESMWHEAMHSVGYDHPRSCTTVGYNYQSNTVPYIVGQCINAVLAISGATCGATDACGADAMPMVTALSATTCQCVKDPRVMGHDLLLTGDPSWTTIPVAITNPDLSFTIHNNAPTTQTPGGTSTSVRGWGAMAANPTATKLAGDFDGDGRTDIVAVGGQGWTSIPMIFGIGQGMASSRDGNFWPANEDVGSFGGWAALPGVQKFVADFNGDGRSDIALFGGADWTSIPIAFSAPKQQSVGPGAFRVTNNDGANFPTWSRLGAKISVADFNGDGKADVALTGVATWTSLPVAFSNGDGSFNITNTALSSFPGWSGAAGVSTLVADFDGDGKADIALTGGSGWTTIPVAFSRGDGSFKLTSVSTNDFPGWAAIAGVRVAADFNNDGRADIALMGGPAWTSLPVAFSNGDGSFNITNKDIGANFASLATLPNARVLTGDFDRDGRMDLAITGVANWTTIPMFLSYGDGNFTTANRNAGSFPGWATATANGAAVFVGNFRE